MNIARALLLVAPLFLLTSSPHSAEAQIECVVVKEGKMNTHAVKLVRAATSDAASVVGLFKAPMAVNTDGAPTSYHPDDFLGKKLAINRIDNGIVIQTMTGKSLALSERIQVFDQWRAGGWVVPPGYRINWTNVIAADPSGKPCVFKDDNAGYLGSLTALKNGLSSGAVGECRVKDQIDERFVPGIVLRGANNPLKRWGAAKGDLVLAINPATGVAVPAVIVDTGDGNRIGEGSVALNMALLGKTDLPTTYPEAEKLDTGKQDMIVAVMPKSALFKRERPYSAKNIAARVYAWTTEHYGSQQAFQSVAQKCAAEF